MKRKIMIIISILIIVFIIASVIYIINKEIIKENNSIQGSLRKVAPYLHEITFADYKFDTDLETINNIGEFRSSSMKNGNYFGNSFFYKLNNVPEFIVTVNAGENRHASIGMAIHFGLEEEKLLNDEYYEELELIPNFTLDGINDCGVVCACSMVYKENTEEVTGTNPEGEKLHMLFIPRFVLDNASSAEKAIELLNSRNIYGKLNDEMDIHIMISDETKTYIVEFIDNKMVAVEKKGNEQIMTNYYNNLDYYTENSAGIERYNILKENYNLILPSIILNGSFLSM